ncbi:probable leucine-rich repeat receptor-like protein kinase At2g28990 [Nymphaea colorata]|nr:probable leucine-rich repeat receptor-like protein kinase At2g28990 [Nymphaea colorata]
MAFHLPSIYLERRCVRPFSERFITYNCDIKIEAAEGLILRISVVFMDTAKSITAKKLIRLIGIRSRYISLNCGLPEGSTSLDEIGYTYTSDQAYIASGEIKEVATQFASSPVMYHTLRSFPNYRRNCYTLTPVTQGKKYLIRASFMYGNYDGQNLLPTFDLYLGAEPWDTVKLDNASHILWTEIIAAAQSSNISVCLVKTAGVNPFISGLELRPADDIYNNTQWPSWLKTYMRINAGSNGPSRFKEDTADRTWTSDYGGYGLPVNTTTRIESTGLFRVPSMVLQTAEYSRSGINIRWKQEAEGEEYVFVFYFAGINRQDNLTVIINGQQPPFPFEVPYMQSYYVYSTNLKFEDYLINISGANLTSVPIINAFEVYKVYEPAGGATYGQDGEYLTDLVNSYEYLTDLETGTLHWLWNAVFYECLPRTGPHLFREFYTIAVDAITGIRDYYQIKKNWASDPCLPKLYPWEGVNCSYGNPMSPTITGLDLSNSELQGSISTEFEMLKSIQSLFSDCAGLSGLCTQELVRESLEWSNTRIPWNDEKSADAVSMLIVVLLKNIRLDCHDPVPVPAPDPVKLVIAICVPIAVVLIIIAIICIVLFKRRHRHTHIPEPRPTPVVPVVPPSPIPVPEVPNAPPPAPVPTVPVAPPPPVPGHENRFSYSDIVRITNNFQTEIGKGGCGSVYLGQLSHGRQVAVKKVTRTEALKSREFSAEIAALTQVHHRSLVSFCGFCEEGVHMMLVYEYMAGGNLRELLSDKTDNKSMFLTWDKRLQMAISVATGLDYLHAGCNPPIIHRDVKTSNILLDGNMEARLADFGLSRAIYAENEPVSTLVVGTTGYIDPEYYRTGKLTTKSDVYSFGVVLFELITGRPAFFSENGIPTSVVQWAKKIIQYGDFHRIIDPRLRGQYDADSIWGVIELAIASLQESGDRRPTMQKIVTELAAAKNQEKRRLGIGTPTAGDGSTPSEFLVDSSTYVETETAPKPR